MWYIVYSEDHKGHYYTGLTQVILDHDISYWMVPPAPGVWDV